MTVKKNPTRCVSFSYFTAVVFHFFWLITMRAVVVGQSYRGSLVILGGFFFLQRGVSHFWLIMVESTNRSSKRKGGENSTVWHRTKLPVVVKAKVLSILPFLDFLELTNSKTTFSRIFHPPTIYKSSYSFYLCIFTTFHQPVFSTAGALVVVSV